MLRSGTQKNWSYYNNKTYKLPLAKRGEEQMHEKKGKDREKSPKEEAEEVKEILGAVSTEIPALIKNILESVFSEEAGRNMGKAAGAFYKELKESGMPDTLALKMTEDYMKTFTKFGDFFKQMRAGVKTDFLSQELAKHTKSEDEED